MKAAVAPEAGAPDRIEILDRQMIPEPAPGTVRVHVKYAGVNPVDVKMLAGDLGTLFPYTPGRDLAGTVESLGEDVEQFAEGDIVFGSTPFGPAGSFATYAVCHADGIAKVPDGLALDVAAALPTAVFTAHQALFAHGELKSGERVLIAGASGGVGSMAVQLAKRAGATVVGAASGENEEYVKGLGADEFLDYKQDPEYASVAPVDLVFDLVGGETTAKAARALKPAGRLVSIANFEMERTPGGVPVRSFSAQPDAAALTEVGAAVAAGEITVEIDSEYPLAEAREALDAIATGHTRGKIVLAI